MKDKNKTKKQLISELVGIRQKTTGTEISKIYETIFDNATDGILLADIENKKFYMGNKMICEMLGYSLEEIKNMGIMDIHPEEDLPYVIEQFEKQSKREIGLAQDIPVKRRDGSIFYVDINSFLITLPGKIYLVGIFRDATERKRAQEKLQSLSRRLAEVQESDHRFLASEFHDQVGQNLTALSINLNVIRGKFSDEFDKKIIDRLEDSLKLVEETMERVRHLMAELRPPVLDDYGLIAAMHWYSERFSERTGIATILQGKEFSPRLPHFVEAGLFRIFQEVLTNVAKHAQARQVSVTLEEVGGIVQLTITDDGVGFNHAGIQQLKEQPKWGLITIEERAETLHGRLYVESVPDKGTRVIVKVPR